MTTTTNMKNTLISLAMLKVQMDDQGQTYIDYFVPYFLQVFKQQFNKVDKQNTEVVFEKTQNDIKEIYGLEIPENVVELIIKRIIKSKLGVLKKENHKYFIVNVENIPGREGFALAERSIITVCNALVEFSKGKPLEFQNIEEAFEAILEFLSEFPIETLENIQKNSALPEFSHRNNKRIVLTALFIQHLNSHDTENYNNFSSIVKGYMLTNVLLCLDITEQNAKIRTCFYIDTPLVLSCLGFNGKARKKSTKELFELILKLGGELCVFSHTAEETQQIIAYYVNRSDTSHNTRRQELSTSDIVIIQEDFENLLNREKIKIKQTPTAANHKKSHKYQIDETKLERMLQEEIAYTGNKAHEYDAKSVAAIHLLRRGDIHYKLEQVPSLITDNKKLVKTIIKFEQENDIGGRCSAITSFMATNLLWLKKPMALPDLPMQTVIAQSYSLLDNPDLWEKFLQKINQLKEKGNITEAEFEYLRGSESVVEKILTEETLGDSSRLESDQKVYKICEEAKRKITRAAKREITRAAKREITQEAKRKITQEAMEKVAVVEKELSDIKKNHHAVSISIARVATIISYAVLAALLFILQYFLQETIITVFVTILSITGLCTYKKIHKFCKNRILSVLNRAQ